MVKYLTDPFVDKSFKLRMQFFQPLIDRSSGKSLLVYQKPQIIRCQIHGLFLSFSLSHSGCKVTMKKLTVGEHFLPKIKVSPCKIFQNAFCRVKYTQKGTKNRKIMAAVCIVTASFHRPA